MAQSNYWPYLHYSPMIMDQSTNMQLYTSPDKGYEYYRMLVHRYTCAYGTYVSTVYGLA